MAIKTIDILNVLIFQRQWRKNNGLLRGMKTMDNKIIMDTNVAAKAATPLTECKDEELDVQQKCMRFIKSFVDNSESKLVLDADCHIIKEYRNRISMKTDMGKIFWKWFNTYISCISFDDYLKLDKDSEGNYVMFPLEERTKDCGGNGWQMVWV